MRHVSNFEGGLRLRLKNWIPILIASSMAVLPASAREVVELQSRYPANTILIRLNERALYLIEDEDTAIRYPVAVPKPGKTWLGRATVDGKYLKPGWAPPAEVKRDNPRIPDYIPGGAPTNPMGKAALTLDRDEIAIHGVSKSMENSIGSAASYGCIRMSNPDILDLYSRVEVGTAVYVTR